MIWTGSKAGSDVGRNLIEIEVRVLFHNSVGQEGVWTPVINGPVP